MISGCVKSAGIKSIIILALISFSQASLFASENWPSIESPPAANVQWVAKDIVQNGVPMQIQTFSSDSSVGDILSYYRSTWNTDANLKAVENTVGEWQVIGKQVGDYYLTVQVKNGNASTSEGYMAVSKLPAFDGDHKHNRSFPRLGGTQVVSDMKSNDDGKIAETLILQNTYSVQSNVGFYEATLPGKGWKMRQSRTADSSHVMYFERSGEACQISINQDRNGKTVMLINISSTRL